MMKQNHSYEIGDRICESQPYMVWVNNEFRGNVCDYCLVKNMTKKFEQCAKCKHRFYCSRNCQRLDWKAGHKFKECELFREVPPSTADQSTEVINLDLLTLDPKAPYNQRGVNMNTCVLVDMLTRLWLKHELDPNARNKSQLYNGSKCGIADLPGFLPKSIEHVVSLTTEMVASRVVRVGLSPCISELQLLFGLLWFNTVELQAGFPACDELGRVLNFDWANFEHSCNPNTCIVFDGRTMYVRATKYIDGAAGEKPTKCYQSAFLIYRTQNTRRNYLKSLFGTACNCLRCQSPDDHGYNHEKYMKLFNFIPQTCVEALESEVELMLVTKKVEGRYNKETTSRLFNCWMMAQSGGLLVEAELFERKFKKHMQITYGPELLDKYMKTAKSDLLDSKRAHLMQRKFHESSYQGDLSKFLEDCIANKHLFD